MTAPRSTGQHMPDGAGTLDRLRAALGRYVVLPSEHAADAVTLWIAASHTQPAWAHAPRLVIRGPEKRCGKSRLLDIIEATCHAPLITVNASTAAVYRSISEDPPTLLVDEADTIFGAAKAAEANEDLRGLLNAGHQRNRPAIRWDAATRTLERCPTFAMAALAGIGAMPDTIEDRAVIVRMRRRAAHESVQPYRHRRDRPPLQALAEQLRGWLRTHLKALEAAEPAMPVEDRAADTWEPLVAVADLAGQGWPDRAREAVLTLTAEDEDASQASSATRLLADCRSAFGDAPALPTGQLLERLKQDSEAPWAEHGPNGLSAMKLGQMLREYGIRSGNVRFPNGTQAKGYQRQDFSDAWARYCPPPAGVPVPGVPAVASQVSAGRLGTVGRLSRPSTSSRPSLTSENEPGTAGTGTPADPAPDTPPPPAAEPAGRVMPLRPAARNGAGRSWADG